MTALFMEPNRVPGLAPKRNSRAKNIWLIIVGVLAAVMTVAIFHIDRQDRFWVGVVVILLMMALMLLRVPIAISMLVASSLGLLALSGSKPLISSLSQAVESSFSSWSLSVIPMFVLMGIAMGKSGITNSAFGTAQRWVGRLPGGLAISSNFAGAGLAAASGSSMGITYAIGRSAIPEMIRNGYKPSLAMGSVAMAGTLGQIIPPSILLVIYASVAQVPVGPQLLAGVIPGILLAVGFSLLVLVWASIKPSVAPRPKERYSFAEKVASLRHLVPVVVIVVVILGGISYGILTATEAGAAGAIAALVMGTLALVWANRRKTGQNGIAAEGAKQSGATGAGAAVRKFFGETFLETVTATAVLFLLILAVNLLSRVMTLSGFAQAIADGIIEMGLSKIGFLMLLIPVYLVLGFFLDTLAMMLLTIPVFMAPLVALDVNLIWFGVFLVILAEIDLVAPPLGILNFVVLSIARSTTKGMPGSSELSITDVFKGVTPFILVAVGFLVLLVAFPEIATWLPDQSQAK